MDSRDLSTGRPGFGSSLPTSKATLPGSCGLSRVYGVVRGTKETRRTGQGAIDEVDQHERSCLQEERSVLAALDKRWQWNAAGQQHPQNQGDQRDDQRRSKCCDCK